MTQPLPWEKNTAVPVPPAPEPVPLDAYAAPAAPEPELVPLDIYDAPAPAPKPAKPLVDIDSLNPAQREAVLTTEGPLLVLAGAGSGKTRVLTFRIAHMLGDLGVKPWQVLAITFTNKAAAEMRERLAALIPNGTRGMWVCTFHAMCVRMLREDADLLGYTGQFTIYDDDDSKRMVRDIMQALGIEQKQFPINMIRSKISSAKNAMIGPEDMLKSADSPNDKKAAQVYLELERRLRAANAMDFDDLLVRTLELLRTRPEVLDKYQERFRYISVDEYQDTNHVQYEIANLLAAKYQNLMVVGDDDQSIYSWRGADITNILDFEQDFKNCKTVKLEQNYRSTGHILSAANAVVRHNSQRKDKRLFTAEGDGEKIQAFQASDERDEGRWIAGEIEKLHSKGTSYDDIAVFYRTNAQSRILEDMFLRAGVPYKIVGGTRFFDRAEIRDVMAYLTLVVNPADDIAAKRVINTPRRGIGKSTVERIEQFAREMDMTFMEGAEIAIADPELRAATRRSVGEFVQIIKDAQSYSGDLRKCIEAVIDKSGLISALQAENTDEARGRVENIQEFLSVVDEFVDTHDEEDADYAAPVVGEQGGEGEGAAEPVRVLRGDSLADFLEWVRLRTDLDTMDEDGQAVTMMTVHASKGLEFDCVFVAGMEETLFPHMNSVGDAAGIEEERRLAYVAITRARKVLFLTCAYTRQIFGQTQANPVSRFIHEIPGELRQTMGVGSQGFSGTGWEKRGSRKGISGSGVEAGGGRVFGRSSASAPGGRSERERREARTNRIGAGRSVSGAYVRPGAEKKAAAKMTFAAGDTVDHKTFGRGKVTKVDGDTLYVRFSKSGQTKKLLKDYAPIVKIG